MAGVVTVRGLLNRYLPRLRSFGEEIGVRAPDRQIAVVQARFAPTGCFCAFRPAEDQDRMEKDAYPAAARHLVLPRETVGAEEVHLRAGMATALVQL